MKLAVLVAFSVCLVGVTLVATADEASACRPPNCPGFGACHVERPLYVDPESGTVEFGTIGVECYY